MLTMKDIRTSSGQIILFYVVSPGIGNTLSSQASSGNN